MRTMFIGVVTGICSLLSACGIAKHVPAHAKYEDDWVSLRKH